MRAWHLLTVAGLLFAFALAWTVAIALLLRRGALLKHDVEEWLGPGRSSSSALAVVLALLLLPAVTFQGWGWLPLWWLALLFVYLDLGERALAAACSSAALAVGPAVSSLDARLRTAENPLFWAGLSAIEGAPDAGRARAARAGGARATRRTGTCSTCSARRASAPGATTRRRSSTGGCSPRDPSDAYARNNLANIEFARGAYDAALARYKAGAEGGGSPEVPGDLLLQPLARAPAEVRLPGLQRGPVERRPRSRSRSSRSTTAGSTTPATTPPSTSA